MGRRRLVVADLISERVTEDFRMDRDQLRAMQAPLKQKYLADPASALVTLRAEFSLGENATYSIGTNPMK
jgi:hypothetical protein